MISHLPRFVQNFIIHQINGSKGEKQHTLQKNLIGFRLLNNFLIFYWPIGNYKYYFFLRLKKILSCFNESSL
jgi:hypothetical protein